MSRDLLFPLVLGVAVCAACAAFGLGAARRAALFVGVGFCGRALLRAFAPTGWEPAADCLVDAGLMVALASLAWKPQARWPLVLVALQGLTTALDLLVAIEVSLRPSTALTAKALVGAALLVMLTWAAWRSRRPSGLSS